jgi:alpha-tubulin suppressor-like RCC1 family protein
VYLFYENLKQIKSFLRSGQLGLGDTDTREWPSNVKALQQQKVTYAACGEKHSVVVTTDGGVFSFGGGMHGQLGHNSTNDELLPRKISELMGSEVIQVACGRLVFSLHI